MQRLSKLLQPRLLQFQRPLSRAFSQQPDDILSQARRQQQQQQKLDNDDMDAQEKERIRRIVDEADKKDNERRKKTARFLSFPVLAGLLAAYVHLGVYSEREEVPDENWFIAHNKRAWHSLKAGVNYWIYPASKKLLPDPLPAPYQLRDTLLLEMSDVLCRPEWDKNNGWRAAMRPGLKQFLLAMSSYYEVVIFTTAPGHLGQPLSVVIDQLGCITYRLFREHTKFDNGKYLKDLSLLNRDLSNVILVDGNPDAYSLQPENGIIIKPWDGSAEDKELFRFTEFLEEIGIMAQVISGPDRNFDFRPLLKVLREIDPEDIPGAWKTHKERLRARFNEKEEEQQAQPTIVNSITNVLKQLVGKSAIRDGAAQVGKVSNLIDTIERIAETQKQQRALKLPEYEKRIAEAKKEQEKQALEPIQEMRDKNAKMIDYLTMQKQ